jgi:hypothetical protein
MSEISEPPALPTPSSFNLFSKLSAELRAKIWNHALYTPRIIQLCFHTTDPQGYLLSLRHRLIPPLLQTCTESRHLALKLYSTPLYNSPQSSCDTYMNLEIDTIYFGSANRPLHFEWLWDIFMRGLSIDFEGIRHIAFDVGWWEWFLDVDMLRWLSSGLKLETITLVLEDEGESGQEAVFVELGESRNGGMKVVGGEEKIENVASKAKKFLERIRKKYEDILSDETNSNRELLVDWPLPELRFMRMEGKILGRLSDNLVDDSEWSSIMGGEA